MYQVIKRSAGYLLIAFIIAIVCCVAGFWVTNIPANRISATKLNNMIKREVPVGSDQAQVEAWLRSKSIQIYNKDYWKNRTINGYIPDTSWGFLRRGDTHISFVFDKNGRMIRYGVSETFADL